MNKKIWTVGAILLAVLIGIVFFVTNRPASNSNDYTADKTSATDNTSGEEETNETPPPSDTQNADTNSNASSPQEKTPPATDTTPTPAPVEKEIATYSTKIYDSDSARQNNISITCKTLNGTTVKKGNTFSFCSTVGQATSSKGYQKANIFDKNGNKKKGLGGGNCQISTTLYNAVMAVPKLVVTERHAHSNYVPYIQKGKDAAVAYGSYDFKFRNDSASDIKIIAQNSASNVTIKLMAI